MSFRDVADQLETLIEATTPDEEPDITFRAAPYHKPLVEQPATRSPAETTRMFHVLPLADARLHDQWYKSESSVQLRQTLRVEIRYQVPLRDGGWRRLHRLSSTDVAAIHQKILSTPSATTWGDAQRIVTRLDIPDFVAQPELYSEQASLWLQIIDYGVVYVLA